MDKTINITVTKPTTIKDLMSETFSRRINAMILKHGGEVLLNGKSFLGNVDICTNDKVQIRIPERSTPYPIKTELPIKIIYRDDDFIVLYKPTGIPCIITTTF